MLGKEQRLKTGYEFTKTRKNGTKIYSDLFNLFYLKLDKPENTRVGIVVPNAVHKSAAKRNRIKRLFREAARLRWNDIAPGYWIAIYPKILCLNADYEKISAEFDKVLQKVPFYRKAGI